MTHRNVNLTDDQINALIGVLLFEVDPETFNEYEVEFVLQELLRVSREAAPMDTWGDIAQTCGR